MKLLIMRVHRKVTIVTCQVWVRTGTSGGLRRLTFRSRGIRQPTDRPLRVHCRGTKKGRGTPCGALAEGGTRPPQRRDRVAQGVGGSVNRRPAPWFRIHHAERRVGQALPLLGDRVAPGGKLQAPRLQFQRRLRCYDKEVGTANSAWELTVDSSLKGKPTHKRSDRGPAY